MNPLKLEKCPVCRAGVGKAGVGKAGAGKAGAGKAGAGNERDSAESCRRCGSDLSLLHETYRAAARLQTAARIAMARDQDGVAVHNAVRAKNLVDNVQTRRTLIAALLKNGLFRAAVKVFVKNPWQFGNSNFDCN